MKTLIIIVLLSPSCFAAFGARTVWEVQASGGADTNGGGFDPGVGSPGTDESITGGAAVTITTASSTTGTSSPAFTSTTHGPGNFVYIASGTGCTVGWHEMVSQSSGTGTFESAIADTTGRTCVGHIGDPIATLGTLEAMILAGNTAYLKGTFTLTGYIDLATFGTSGHPITYIGYDTARGDNGQAIIALSGAGNGFLINVHGDYQSFFNITADVSSAASNTAWLIQGGSGVHVENSKAINFTTYGFYVYSDASDVVFTGNLAQDGSGCSAAYYSIGSSIAYYGNTAKGNACSGFNVAFTGNTSPAIVQKNISTGNTGGSSDGFIFAGPASVTGNIAYSNGRDGIRFSETISVAASVVYNNILVSNSGYGLNFVTNNWGVNPWYFPVDNNAYYNNTTANRNNAPIGASDVTLSGVPFTNAGSGDYSLNNTAGQGAACRGAGRPNTFLGLSTTGHVDIGPVQSAGSGSSGTRSYSSQ